MLMTEKNNKNIPLEERTYHKDTSVVYEATYDDKDVSHVDEKENGTLYWHYLEGQKVNRDGYLVFYQGLIGESDYEKWEDIPSEIREVEENKVEGTRLTHVKTFDHEPTEQELYDIMPEIFK